MKQPNNLKNKPTGHSENRIHNSHDKMLFNTLKNRHMAKDLMINYFPQELSEQIDFKQMSLYKTKLVTPQWKEFQADIIYQIKLKDRAGLCLFHCEHQSTPEANMPLRVWQYILLLLMEYHENHPGEPLPIIYPIVVYTGETKYNKSTDFFDLFGKQKEQAQKYLLKPIQLIDVCRLDDKEIDKHTLFGVSEFAFKYKRTMQFERFIEALLPKIHRVEFKIGVRYARMILEYVVTVFPHGDVDLLIKKIRQYLSKELGAEAMTIAQQLEARGMQQGILQGVQQGLEQGLEQGRQEGCQEGIQKTAWNLLRAGSDPQFVSKVTGLPISKLAAMLERQLEKDETH